MTVFTVGKARIARIEETYGPTYRARDIFPEFDDRILAKHAAWLAPSHYDAASGFIKLSVHSWLLQIGGQNILIDGCCGNNKIKPARPFWNMLNIPWLERLAAAGARPEEIDYVMCTHLHHDHVGWNTLQRDGRWVPTFPKARYVFSKPDFERLRPEQRAGGVRHLPRMRAAGGGGRARGPRDRAAPPQRLHRDLAGTRPFRRPCRVRS